MAKLLVRGILLVSLIAIIGTLGYAEEWTIYGPRAMGMGGTGVAVADGATASYWNPAAITLNSKIGLYLPFGTTISAEGEILNQVDTVFNSIESSNWSSISAKMNAGTMLSLDETRAALDLFVNKIPKMNEPGQGLLYNLTAGATITLGEFGIFANFLTDAAFDPSVSLNENMSFNAAGGAAAVFNMVGNGNDRSGAFTNPASQGLANSIATIFTTAGTAVPQDQAEELIYQAELAGVDTSDPELQNLLVTIASATAGTGGNVSMNASGITLSGIVLKEIGITYGWKFMENKLSLGGNLKMMQGETFYKFYRFDNMPEGDDLTSDITGKNNVKKTTNFGLDLGALYSLTDNMKVGLTGRNLNSPKFDWKGPGDIKLGSQLRAGVAYQFPVVLLAADYDLNKNESDILQGYESQMYGLGAEFNLWLLKLRAGLYKNQASKESGSVYTFGTSLNLLLLDLDLAGAMSTDEVDIGDDEIKERYSIGLGLSFRF